MITAISIDGILLLILLFIILVKTKHFYRYIGSKRRSFLNWIFFGHKKVIGSRSKRSMANKQKQNSYSLQIGVILIVLVFAVALEVTMLDQPLPGLVRPSERPAAPTIKR